MRDPTHFVGVDIGGTFTDVILAEQNSSRLFTAKTLTTPNDPSAGVLSGLQDVLQQAKAAAASIDRVVHATTLATNLILEGKGATVAYVATKGFGDTLLMGRERRVGPDRYDLLFEKSEPPVPKHLIIEANERIDHTGSITRPLNHEDLEEQVGKLAQQRPEAVAVCLLHSYKNPIHENQVAEALRRLLPSAYIALSSEVWPEYREYERATTTVMSAYVGPLMASYVKTLEEKLKQQGVQGVLQIMQSGGGVMSAASVATKPIQSVESGPAAGVIAAVHWGRLLGINDLVSFDMGGTTAKAGLVRDGKPHITHDFHVGGSASYVGSRRIGTGYPIKIPVIDLAEVGAGGGSIAWVDAGGSLQVGPNSAGANPGPACYGFGGDDPTVTDADLILGYLNPDYFLGGKMEIDPALSRKAIETVAQPLGMDVITAASGICEITNTNMGSAVRIVTVERGIDPRQFSLIAFGGAGPVHAVRVAEQFEIPTIIVPITPGLASAVGLLVSDMTHDYVRTHIMDPEETDVSLINVVFEELELAAVSKMEQEGVQRPNIVLQRQLDTRFRFQAHELSVPIHSGKLTEKDIHDARESFRNLYEELYGLRQETNPVQIVNLRVRVIGSVPKIQFAAHSSDGSKLQGSIKGSRPVHFRERGGFVETNVYDRLLLNVGDVLTGPAVIEEPDSTTIIPPQYTATIDPFLSIIIRST